MPTHLTDDMLMDLCEGTAGPDARAHAQACGECRARVEEAAEGLILARQAGVPEPSPLYWPVLRRNVEGRIDASPVRRRAWWAPPLLVAASVMAVVALLPSRTDPPPSAPVPAHLPAWSALPPAEEDPGLPFLAEVAPLAASDAVAMVSCQDVARCLATLDDEESGLLAEALSREWQGEAL